MHWSKRQLAALQTLYGICVLAHAAHGNLVCVLLQLKRTNVGISLVSNPRVLFLDEPTSGATFVFPVIITWCNVMLLPSPLLMHLPAALGPASAGAALPLPLPPACCCVDPMQDAHLTVLPWPRCTWLVPFAAYRHMSHCIQSELC